MYKHNYAITVKKNFNPLISDYDNYFKKLEDDYPKASIIYMFEYGERNCLHAHGRVSSNTKIYRNKIRPKGWGFDFDLEKHPNAWARYMTKNAKHQSRIILDEYEKERGLLEHHFQKELEKSPTTVLLSSTEKKHKVLSRPLGLESNYSYPHLDIRKLCS